MGIDFCLPVYLYLHPRYIHLWRSREGALLEIIPPTRPVRSDGERVIFNRPQRLSGVSMPCSSRPDSSEMVPFYQL